MIIIETHGRTTILANYTEKELLSGTREEQGARVVDILSNIKFSGIHEKNAQESKYLEDYMYGIQDIRFKVKKTRTDINNTSVENWAYAMVDWKKTFLLGKPVQYAPINDVSNEEIIELNNYMSYENKNSLDLDLWEDVLATGRGFRYNNSTKISDEDEAPFEIINLDPHKTEVVYSSSINKEQLCAYVQTKMIGFIEQWNEIENIMEKVEVPYNEYTVYTRNACFIITDKNNEWKIVKSYPLILKEHIVTEYYLNKRRMSIIELGKDIFDDINYVENLDLDDIEQFVNSIMVFTNAEINKEGMDAIKEYGAVSIKSTEQRKASVEILQSRLKSLDTQIYYLRKISALHNILSVPQASNDGSVNAETGKAMLTGQGFTSSSIRVEGEELAFKRGDKNSLKTIIKICKRNPKSKIKNLKVSDIEIKLSRDLSENLLTKTQALMNLATANIPPEIRNQVINLFSDPVAVTKLQEKYEEERRKLQEEMMNKNSNNNENKVNEQNNKIKKTKENENQGN